MTANPARTRRTRNLTAAKRSLKLIQEAITEHQAALEAGDVPRDGFTASVIKYEHARIALGTIDALADGEPALDAGEPVLDAGEIPAGVREDLAPLIEVLNQPWARAALGMPAEIAPDSPLGRLTAALS